MRRTFLTTSLGMLIAAGFAPSAAQAQDLCAGRIPGTISFHTGEIERGKPLPPVASAYELGKPMYALACLADATEVQPSGGKKFRVVLSIKQTKSYDGKYSSYQASAKQEGVFRPEITKPRKDLIVYLHEDFDLSKLAYKLEPGEYSFRLQAASEQGTGQLDLTIQATSDTATLYVQELRKAGYLADGQIMVTKKD